MTIILRGAIREVAHGRTTPFGRGVGGDKALITNYTAVREALGRGRKDIRYWQRTQIETQQILCQYTFPCEVLRGNSSGVDVVE